MYKILSKYPIWLKTYGNFHIFTFFFFFFCFSVALANEKWHLASILGRSCWPLSVCQKLSKYSQRFKHYGHFNRPTTDRQSQGDYRVFFQSQPFNRSTFLWIMQFLPHVDPFQNKTCRKENRCYENVSPVKNCSKVSRCIHPP